VQAPKTEGELSLRLEEEAYSRVSHQCGEQKPTCSGCIKHETACNYPHAPHAEPLRSLVAASRLHVNVPADSSESGSTSRASSMASGPPLPAPHSAGNFDSIISSLPAIPDFGQFNRTDLVLVKVLLLVIALIALADSIIRQWHHFITSTAATMTALWEGEMPLLTLSCDYLIHGMLSFAALHLAYLYPGQRHKYELLATHHQSIALPLFQTELSSISTDDCHQIFAFSLVLMITNFAPSFSMNAA
jgi:hypothetical protein